MVQAPPQFRSGSTEKLAPIGEKPTPPPARYSCKLVVHFIIQPVLLFFLSASASAAVQSVKAEPKAEVVAVCLLMSQTHVFLFV